MTAKETKKYENRFLLEVIEKNTGMDFERISKKRLRDVLIAEKQDIDVSLTTEKLKEKVIEHFLSHRKKLKCFHCKKIGHDFKQAGRFFRNCSKGY